jgi:hypothetical protein
MEEGTEMGNKKGKRNSNKTAVIIIVTTICVVAAAFVGAAFAGVQPLATYKDNIIKGVTTSTSAASQPLASTQTPDVVTVESIYACPTCGHVLVVGLTPTPLTKADYPYKVDLFEKGKLRQTGSVTWRQGEIDNKRAKGVEFDLTAEEWESYLGRNVDDIFSVSVH